MTVKNANDTGDLLGPGAQVNSLPTPQTAADFSFPITPYDIQLQFMRRLFETIEDRQFAIFESPTGTGKSLSIICGALTWLIRDAERPKAIAGNDDDTGSKSRDHRSMAGEPDWVVAFENKRAAEEEDDGSGDAERLAMEKYHQWVVRTRRREAGERKAGRTRSYRSGGVPSMETSAKITTTNMAMASKRSADTATAGSNGTANNSDSDDCLVDAYYSDTGTSKGAHSEHAEDGPVKYSEDVRKLLERRTTNRPYYDSDSQDESETNPNAPPEEPSVTKVFYASRTHSQLQQFVREIKRTQFASGDNRIKCVTLGSRMQLCTNDRVRQQSGSSVYSLNERCAEMQQGSGRAKRCSFLPAQRTPMLDFKDSVGRRIMDIEELAGEGRRLSVCSYYGARESVRSAHVVALPYNMLLSKSARESMGLSLKGNVVIVDEAHNLVDTILAIHSVSLDWTTVKALLELLQKYFARYWRRLKGSNTVYIRQAIALLKAFDKFMKQCSDQATNAVISVGEFLERARADHINMYKIDRYLRVSRLGRKLNMFAEPDKGIENGDLGSSSQRSAKRGRLATKTGGGKAGPLVSEEPSRAPSPATAVAAFESFIERIGNPSRAGARLVVNANGKKEVGLKYLLLDPSESFSEICKDARAVVLAGGTMKPANDAIEQLLPKQSAAHAEHPERCRMLDPANARIFAWSHVVAPSHVCAQVVSAGPTGAQLKFALQDQSDGAKLREAGGALAALCNVVPGGVVVFFPSYSLLRKMHAEWSAAGIVGRIARKKPVFAEVSSQPGQPQKHDVLGEYTKQVKAPGSTGAVLLSVVGGKLSEGINFSDELGRAVVMVGVPYPNLASPELVERLEYYESQGSSYASRHGDGSTSSGASRMGVRGRELYESLCMRAVNQSIGRAIRHRGDYAAIVFLDCRYAEPQIASKLPGWIAGGSNSSASGKGSAAVPCSQFGPALANIASFFKRDFTNSC
ncbi:ATP-dependent DNA helicase chl1 [Coemansia sp. RSA 1200]|nr:ATP-dependent DNA helicase chl1 [Coemansia sp. RSA 1200]